jgi:hypothetical protein
VVWTGFAWLTIGTSRRLLWTRWWNYGFHKMFGKFLNSWAISGFLRRTEIRGLRGSNPAVDRGCVYSVPPTGVKCVPSTHRVCLVSVMSPILILAILIQVCSVVHQSLDSVALNRLRHFYVLSNISFKIIPHYVMWNVRSWLITRPGKWRSIIK